LYFGATFIKAEQFKKILMILFLYRQPIQYFMCLLT